jgi:hypothetical protein
VFLGFRTRAEPPGRTLRSTVSGGERGSRSLRGSALCAEGRRPLEEWRAGWIGGSARGEYGEGHGTRCGEQSDHDDGPGAAGGGNERADFSPVSDEEESETEDGGADRDVEESGGQQSGAMQGNEEERRESQRLQENAQAEVADHSQEVPRWDSIAG